MKNVKHALPIIERDGRFILQKTFKGVGQKQVPLGVDSKIAKSRAVRFLATAESSGFEIARAELDGKPVIKAGANPTFEQMEILYREFCGSRGKSIRPQTIKMNLGRLRFIMKKAGVERVGEIDKDALPRVWFKNSPRTPTAERTFASAIASASGVFRLSALAYYKSRNIPLENPFKGTDTVKPKVSKYIPVPQTTRERIYMDCETELAPSEAMIVLMALGIGMRRSEIAAAIPAWFSKQTSEVLVHIREEQHFQPKTGEDGVVPIKIPLYETLLRLRGNSDSFYFVPTGSKLEGGVRIRQQTENVNKWLHGKGMNQSHPLHSLRKECGSMVAKSKTVLEASKILRNTPQVCAIHYAGIAEVSPVDMAASFEKPQSAEEAYAASLRITVEELRRRVS
jgi:integrase